MGPFKAKISSNHKLNFRRSTHDKLGGGGGGEGGQRLKAIYNYLGFFVTLWKKGACWGA